MNFSRQASIAVPGGFNFGSLFSVIITMLLFFAFFSSLAASMAAPNSGPLAIQSSASAHANTKSLSVTLNVCSGCLVMTQIALSPQSAAPQKTPYGCLAPNATCSILTSVTASGLTFQQRMAYTDKPSSADETWAWEYYACPAPSAGSYTMTAAFNNTAQVSMIAYAVSGIADCGSPFANSLSFQGGIFANQQGATAPGDFNDCNLSSHCGITFSTTQNSLVVFGIATQGDPTALPPTSNPSFPGALSSSNRVNYTMIQDSITPSWMSNAISYATFTNAQVGIYTGDYILFNPNNGQLKGESAFWFTDAFQGVISQSTTSSTSTISTSSSSTISSSTSSGGGNHTSSSSSSSSSTISSQSTVTITKTITQTSTVTQICTSGTFQYVNGTLTGKCAT